jgi:hypothetical protein
LKQVFYINSANTEEAIQKVLSMQIGERHCSFAITNKTGDELYSLAYYTAAEINTECLAEIFSKHKEFNHSFYETQLSYEYPRSVLVPLQHYHTDDARLLLNTMHGNNGQSSIVTEIINEWQLCNVYGVPGDVHEWISRKFPSGKYRHSFTLGIRMMPAGPADRLLIDIRTDEFSFIAIKENKLLMAQTHSYSSPEDILFWLLKVCNQFSLSREEVQLSVSGLIEKDSQLFKELYLHFLHAGFRQPVWNMPAAEGGEYPAHFFTTLNDLARCAS